MKIAIQLSKSKIKNEKSSRYLSYIDDRWYETSDKPVYLFDEESLDKIKVQMKNKYLYYCTILYDNGLEKEWSAFNKKVYSVVDSVGSVDDNGLCFTMKI